MAIRESRSRDNIRRGRDSVEPVHAKETDMAVVGMACRFPGAENYADFWENLAQGRSNIREIPAERWDWKAFWGEPQPDGNASNCKWGGFISDVDVFDQSFFGLSAREAETMDPQQRIMLELSWSCFEDAGIRPSQVSGEKIGVYIGVFNFDYKELQEKKSRIIETYHSTGTAAAVIPNRISHYFNFKGPSLAIDTACSSSLNAIHSAMRSLEAGECSMALAGGISLLLTPTRHISFSKTGMLSSQGACKTFDESADGYVRSEGAGLILIKPLKRALADGDVIYGVLKGSAVNHSGKTHTLTYPNPEAQAEVIIDALKRAETTPDGISYIEAHGTGTPKGDPIEFQGLLDAFRSFAPQESRKHRTNYCGLGSVKTNIGHLESAAGIAGVIKVLLSMKHRQLPGLQNFKQLNHRIEIQNSPFYIIDRLRAWKPLKGKNSQTLPRRAGVSSFGFGGTNAHVVIEEAPTITRPVSRKAPYTLVCLSAKTEKALQQRERNLALWLKKEGETVTLPEISATLLLGREHFGIRAAYVVRDIQELQKKLDEVIHNGRAEGYFRGSGADNEKQPPFREFERTDLKKLRAVKRISEHEYRAHVMAAAELYTSGHNPDGKIFYRGPKPRRISLPTYPFAREHHWISKVLESSTPGHTKQPITGTAPVHSPKCEKPSRVSLVSLSDHGMRQPEPAENASDTISLSTGILSTKIDNSGASNRVTHVQAGFSQETIQEELTTTLAAALYMKRSDIDPGKKFVDMGLDSIIGVEWIRAINKQYGTSIAATKVYDYPSIREFADFLEKELSNSGQASKRLYPQPNPFFPGVPEPETASENATKMPSSINPEQLSADQKLIQEIRSEAGRCSSKPSNSNEAIAIIGMSGRYPGAANLDQYWDNLVHAKNSIREVPISRWDVNRYYDPRPSRQGKVYCKWIGLLDDIDHFDPLFFDIPPAEAELMDPQHRIFLQEGYKAFEDAGYSGGSLSNKKCGVYLGIMSNEYGILLRQNRVGAANITGNSHAIAAARIPYFLNLKGPAIPVDTACSSSLVAAHLACQALLSREIDMALAGGVTLYLAPESYIGMCAAGMLSPDGQCKAFDNSADGFVPGEGVGALVLKRLKDAEADHDHIYGIIIGSGTNQDGKTNGITAPSANSQIELEREIYRKYNIDPESIGYVEMHGTGTKLGDPIELEALSTAFKERTNKKNYCAIGSVKTNIGHTSAAAGVAGLQKVLLCLKHKELVPTLNFEKPNEHFKFEDSPLYVNTKFQPWDVGPGTPRRACVSSFGFSGTNAHMVVEEYNPGLYPDRPTVVIDKNNPILFILSAKTEEQLRTYAESMKTFIESRQGLNLADMAYTLQTGRDAMEYRLAFSAVSREGLTDALESFDGNHPSAVPLTGRVKTGKNGVAVFEADDDARSLLQIWVQKKKLKNLAELWVKGLNIDWEQLYSDARPRRITLPTYPFARERYWIPAAETAADDIGFQIQACSEAPTAPGPGDLKSAAIEQLKKMMSEVTKIPIDRLDPEASFEEFGLDSVVISTLNKRIEHWVGKLDAALFFKYNTIQALGVYFSEAYPQAISELINKSAAPGSKHDTDLISGCSKNSRRPMISPDPGIQANTDIAIIGIAGRYPQAATLDQFWSNLYEGRDCIQEIPPDRWSLDGFFEPDRIKAVAKGLSYSKWGGFLDNVDCFDPLFFNISPRDAIFMDPQERLFLQAAWECLEDAGYTRKSLEQDGYGNQIGVFVGATFNNYQLFMTEAALRANRNMYVANSQIFSIANRVSFVMNFTGPSLTVDTACSSSLYAVHLACESIRSGQSRMAIAGGVNLSLHPSKYILLSKEQFSASDGRCRAFSEGGTGYVPSEGVGAIFLKPLQEAIRDDDLIHGIIKGTAASHAGRTNGYTVPSPVSQSLAIEKALVRSQIDPRTITCIEAHGTGTALGDPIEITGLTDVFRKYTEETGFCSISSVKSNIGHAEAASGIAQMTKVLLQFRHQTLVKNVMHGKGPNPNIDLADTPFVLQEKTEYWKRPVIGGREVPRRAGVSSFGAGGANAHVVIEEYIPEENKRRPVPIIISPENQAIIVLSARNADRLKEQAERLLTAVKEQKFTDHDLHDIAYTLQVGREAMEERLAMTVRSINDVQEKLNSYLEGRNGTEDIHHGQARRNKEGRDVFPRDEDATKTITNWIAKGNYAKVMDLWVKGLNLDWNALYRDRKPRRVSLPAYPFAKERYWVREIEVKADSNAATPAGEASIHPLPHQRAITLATPENMTVSPPSDKPNRVSLQSLSAHHDLSRQPITTSRQAISLPPAAVPARTDGRMETGTNHEAQPAVDLHQPSVTGESLREALRTSLAEALYMKRNDVDPDKQFIEMGLDSIVAIEWIQVINNKYGLSIQAPKVYEYPSVSEFAGFLAEELSRHESRPQNKHVISASLPKAEVSPQPGGSSLQEKHETAMISGTPEIEAFESSTVRMLTTSTNAREHESGHLLHVKQEPGGSKSNLSETPDIAIIGLSGRYPGAKSLREFWENLRNGRDCITEIPKDRWDLNIYFDEEKNKPGKTCCKWGGFIEEADLFDPLFFNLSPREAELIDPQERLFLETVWNLFESIGYTREMLHNRYEGRVGVYAGVMYHHYNLGSLDSESLQGSLANRVSYFFDLQGPSMVINTMCSSSAIAVHLACESLRKGECRLAIAGGVNLSIHPKKYLAASLEQAIGSHINSRSFGNGDGYLPAEGVGAVLLKPLADALHDRDDILAVIKATTMNHDGQSNGYFAPNPNAQAQLIEENFKKAGIDPRTISYVESAANGSALGDAIEVNALTKSFQKFTNDKQFCAIGSVKSNIGHAEAASGISQLTKVILQLQHQELVPSIKAEPLNPSIRFDSTPFYLVQGLRKWERPVVNMNGEEREFPRLATVSSFGAGGSNAHLIIEEYIPAQKEPVHVRPAPSPQIMVFSARGREQLQAVARQMVGFLELNKEVSFPDLAYTLQIGRESMEYRVAMVVNSQDELLRSLKDCLRSEEDRAIESPVSIFRGDPDQDQSGIRNLFSGKAGETALQVFLKEKNLDKIAALWAQGARIPWESLHQSKEFRKISLPPYPFVRKRYWISDVNELRSEESEENRSRGGQFEGLPGSRVLAAYLRKRIGELLSIPAEDLPARQSLNKLGFTSVNTVTLKYILEKDFGTEIPLSVVGAHQSIESMKSTLSDLINIENTMGQPRSNSQMSTLLPTIIPDPAQRYELFPLNDIQESFLTGRSLRFGDDRVGCHIYFEIEASKVDVYRLNNAWEHLIVHHEMLRCIISSDGQQKISEKSPPYKFKVIDLRRKSGVERSEYINFVRNAMSHRVYEPGHWPLFEIRISICPDKTTIHFSIDEFIVDASGVYLLLEQWQQLYENPSLKLPQLDVSFRDYVFAVKKFEDSTRFKEDLEYWIEKLENMPQGPTIGSEQKRDRAANKETPYRTRLKGALDEKQWQSLKNKAEKLSVSPSVLLLTIFSEVLRFWTDQETFSLILTYFNRLPLHPQVDKIVGPFISTIIFTIDKRRGRSFEDLIKYNDERIWQNLDHASVSGIRVLRELKARRKISGSLYLPVVFTSLINNVTRESAPEKGGFVMKPSFTVTQTPQVYLDHQVLEQDGKLIFSWDVVEKYFGSDVIRGLFSDYCRVLFKLSSEDARYDIEELQTEIMGSKAVKKCSQIEDLKAHNDPAATRIPPPGLQIRPSASDRFQPFPLTDQQQAYVFGRSKHISGGDNSCQVYQEFEIEDLDIKRLEQAWIKLMQTHDMLITKIQPNGMQRTMEEFPDFKIKISDLTGKNSDEVQTELAATKRNMVERVIGLDEWPYFDIRVSVMDGLKSRVHFSIDLLIADAQSIYRLMKQLFYLYQHSAEDPKKPGMLFRDYVLWLKEYQNTQGYKNSIIYWKNKFGDIAPGPQLPMKRNGSSPHCFERKQLQGVLENWEALKRRAAQLSVSPGMVLLTTYAEVFSAWLGHNPFSIVIPSWERVPLHSDIHEVVGDFTSMSWVLIAGEKMTFEEKVRRNHMVVQEDLSHRAVSGLKALRKNVMRGGHKGILTFPIVFTDLATDSDVKAQGFTRVEMLSKTPQVYVDNISEEHDGRLAFYWDVAKGIYPEGLIEEIFSGYERVLQALANDPASWGNLYFDKLINARPEKYRIANIPGRVRS